MTPTDDELRAIRDDYEADLRAAEQRRIQRLRDAVASGRTQADIVRITGWTRETIRRIVDPAIREAINAARRKPA
jgi:hypothetical protein